MKKMYFLLLSLLLLIGLSGCTKNSNYKYEDFYRLELSRNDKYSNEPNRMINGNKTKTNNAEYYFEEGITLTNRNSTVNSIESIIKYIGFKDKINYYIGKSLHNGIVEVDNKKIVYLDYDDIFKTLDMIIHTTIYIAGDNARYGIIYGYSRFIANILNIKYQDINYNKDDLIDFIINNNEVIDLNHPLFVSHFEDDNTVKYSKALSIEFTNYLISTIGVIELKNIIKNKSQIYNYYDLMYSYLKTLKIQLSSDFKEINMKFTPHSVRYPTKIEGDRLVYLFSYNYEDEGFNINCKYGIFDLSYKYMKRSVMEIEKSINELINYISPDFNYLTVTNANVIQGKPTYYLVNNPMIFGEFPFKKGAYTNFNYIVSTTLYSIIHEYAHIIAESIKHIDSIEDKWLIEGFVEYCNADFNIYKKLYYLEIYGIVIENNDVHTVINDKDYIRMRIYDQFLKEEQKDFYVWDYDEIVRYDNGVETTFNGYGGRQFLNYLIKTYGLELFIELYKNTKWIDVYNKSLDDLILEFDSYLSNKYSKYFISD